MINLTAEGQSLVQDLARRYGLSLDAVQSMLQAVDRGHGSMAQFNIPELGGNGQWMLGGMTMVGDMFNSGLKSTVDNLCNELSRANGNGGLFERAPQGGGFRGSSSSSSWWPQDLGQPSSTGSQNAGAYAVFPGSHRLAIRTESGVLVYDTLDHTIGGVSQQQGSSSTLTFSSQFGSFPVSSLPLAGTGNPGGTVDGAGMREQQSGVSTFAQPMNSQSQSSSTYYPVPERQPLQETVAANVPDAAPESPAVPPTPAAQHGGDSAGIIALIEKLGALRDGGLLTPEEFQTKKMDLLGRL